MTSNALYGLTIHEALHLLETKEISAVELTDAVLGRIRELEPEIGRPTRPTLPSDPAPWAP
jgi:Asp-tRNA(Asn)/Glu-tRNA(Gln) amidotransferase A subunit family amidase